MIMQNMVFSVVLILLKLLTVSSCVVNRTQPSALLATVQLPAGSGTVTW